MNIKFHLDVASGAIVLTLPVLELPDLIGAAREYSGDVDLISDNVEVKNFEGFAIELVEHLNETTLSAESDQLDNSEIQEIVDYGSIRHAIFDAVNDVVERGSSHLTYSDEPKVENPDEPDQSEPFHMNK